MSQIPTNANYAPVVRDNGTHSLLIVGSNVAILSRYNRPDFCYWIKPRGQQRPFACKKELGIFINIFETIWQNIWQNIF